jgi:hypothetical protein
MKKSIRLNTLVRLQSEYKRHYDMGYKPEAAIAQALTKIGLPQDFKRDDYELIGDAQDPKAYGLQDSGF